MDVEKQVKEEDEDAPSLVAEGDSDSPLSEISDIDSPVKVRPAKSNQGSTVDAQAGTQKATFATNVKDLTTKKDGMKEPQFLDPEADGEEEADEEEIQAALSRPPPANSDFLPLPWKGRLGYVRANFLS